MSQIHDNSKGGFTLQSRRYTYHKIKLHNSEKIAAKKYLLTNIWQTHSKLLALLPHTILFRFQMAFQIHNRYIRSVLRFSMKYSVNTLFLFTATTALNIQNKINLKFVKTGKSKYFFFAKKWKLKLHFHKSKWRFPRVTHIHSHQCRQNGVAVSPDNQFHNSAS